MTSTFLLRFSLVGLALCFVACTPSVEIDPSSTTENLPLDSGTNIGQSFTSKYNGLTSVDLYLQPLESGTGDVQLTLYENPIDEEAIANASLPVKEIESPGWYRFNFAPLSDSYKQDYFLELENDGSGVIQVAAALSNRYLDGSAYLDASPLQGQLVFSTVYDPAKKLVGLVNELINWGIRLIVAIWLFILPGWALMLLLLPGYHDRNWLEKAAISIGISLAIYPILFLWTHLLGMNLGRLYAWIPPIASSGVLAFLWLRRIRSRVQPIIQSIPVENSNLLPNFALIAILVLVIITRLWAIRMLDIPMWGDSYQHTMIAQLMVDNAGLFNTWLPYAQLTTFTYHFGFHTLVAVFHWVTGMPLPVATLWTGQIINIFAIITLAPLTLRLSKSRWSAVIAILVAGLLVPMPNFYVNWGRYTQLSGQVILLISVYVLWRYFDESRNDWKLLVTTWLILGGLALTHYRILILAILFIIAYFILQIRDKGWDLLIWRITLVGLGIFIIFLPWLIRVFTGSIDDLFVNQISTPAGELSTFARQYNSIGDLLAYMSPVVWVLLLVSVAWGLWRRDRGVLLLSAWWIIIILATNPNWFNLPGAGVISNFTVLIAAYIPAGIFIGASGGWLTNQSIIPGFMRSTKRVLFQITALVIILALGVWGVLQRLQDINPLGSVLFTRADQRAATWIQENLPDESRFLVNAFFAYGNWVLVGSDGGWWLPLLAGRNTTLPPINYGNERGPTDNYRQWVNQLQSDIDLKGLDHPDVIRELLARGVEFVYIGQRQGEVNNSGNALDPQVMLNSPNFNILYHQDQVYIFEVLPDS